MGGFFVGVTYTISNRELYECCIAERGRSFGELAEDVDEVSSRGV